MEEDNDESAHDSWCSPFRFAPADDGQISKLTPTCRITWGSVAKEVCIYPKSQLISIDKYKLFSCRECFMSQLFPMEEDWHRLLSATTHVGLSRDEDDALIFLTRRTDGGSLTFSFANEQPFGIWAVLNPLPIQGLLHLQKRARAKYQARVLAFAQASHPRLGHDVDPWMKEVMHDSELVRAVVKL